MSAADVGLYECVAGGDFAFALSSAYLFVDTGGRKPVAPPDDDADRIVYVVAKEKAVIPCR